MKNSQHRRTITEEITGTVSEIIKQVRRLIRKGNARRIIIQNNEGKILFQSQLTVGIAGTAALTAIAPIVSAISMFALFMNDIKIIVEKYPEEHRKEEDEYEVEADFIDIRDEEEEETEKKNKEEPKDSRPGPSPQSNPSEKTVGKNDDREDL